MHCTNCGNKISHSDKFCTSCGYKVSVANNTPEVVKKGFAWKTALITCLLTSFVWFFYYFGFVDKSTKSANVVAHLLETIGRQQQAWDKSEQVTELITAGLSDECLYTEGCVDEVINQITILRAEIDKESAEIDNLWAENVIGNDFEIFYSSLDETNQIRLMDVMNIYFPEETIELETSTQLL